MRIRSPFDGDEARGDDIAQETALGRRGHELLVEDGRDVLVGVGGSGVEGDGEGLGGAVVVDGFQVRGFYRDADRGVAYVEGGVDRGEGFGSRPHGIEVFSWSFLSVSR